MDEAGRKREDDATGSRFDSMIECDVRRRLEWMDAILHAL
jgi:hypothetical protein